MEKPKLEAARAARGFTDVPADDNEYLTIINAARTRLAQGEPPAMLCIPYAYFAGGDPCKTIAGGDLCDTKAGGDPCSVARGVKTHSTAGETPALTGHIKTKPLPKGTRVLTKWQWFIYLSQSIRQ